MVHPHRGGDPVVEQLQCLGKPLRISWPVIVEVWPSSERVIPGSRSKGVLLATIGELSELLIFFVSCRTRSQSAPQVTVFALTEKVTVDPLLLHPATASANPLVPVVDPGEIHFAVHSLQMMPRELLRTMLVAGLNVGLPECVHALSQATIYLALAPKSKAATRSIGAAIEHVRRYGAAPPPPAVRSQAVGYDSPHDHPGHLGPQEVAPDEVAGTRFYEPDEQEARLRERLQVIRQARGQV